MSKGNFFISYDLNSPGQDYTKVAAALRTLGASMRIQRSMLYLRSSLTYEQIFNVVWASMDANDSLVVIEAKTATCKTRCQAPSSSFRSIGTAKLRVDPGVKMVVSFPHNTYFWPHRF